MYKLGLIGHNIAYSFSKKYFDHKFRVEGITNFSYEVYDLPEIAALDALMSTKNLIGLNVTIPYKEAVLTHLGELSTACSKIGAANTLVRKGACWVGHNTDVLGLNARSAVF